MNQLAIPTPELRQILLEYEDIQRQERALRDQKEALREKLVTHMRSLQAAEWTPEIDGRPFKVRYRHSASVEYDEELLRQRLGDRYRQVLGPDPRKVRRHLDEVAHLLEPSLDIVGSPMPDKVKAAIASGLVSADEFKGAFNKTQKDYIAVSQPTRPSAAASNPNQ